MFFAGPCFYRQAQYRKIAHHAVFRGIYHDGADTVGLQVGPQAAPDAPVVADAGLHHVQLVAGQAGHCLEERPQVGITDNVYPKAPALQELYLGIHAFAVRSAQFQ